MILLLLIYFVFLFSIIGVPNKLSQKIIINGGLLNLNSNFFIISILFSKLLLFCTIFLFIFCFFVFFYLESIVNQVKQNLIQNDLNIDKNLQ